VLGKRSRLDRVAGCNDTEMILEQAHLDVIPDQEVAFEAAFARARLIISAMPGFRSLRLSRAVRSGIRDASMAERKPNRLDHAFVAAANPTRLAGGDDGFTDREEQN
jgi:hypothetical protein